jgi:Flp pilus assembly protein TadG
MVLLAFAAVDLARGYSERTTVAAAAEAAVRSFAADPSADVNAAAKSQDPGTFTSDHCSASPGPTPTASFGEVQVTLTCTFTPLTPLLKNIVGTPVVKIAAVARTTY